MSLDVIIYTILAILYIGSLVSFIFKLGPYGRFNTKRRDFFKFLLMVSGVVMIGLTISLIVALISK